MKIYIYCSYQSSPVGFKLGTIHYDSSHEQDYIPTNKDIEPFVQKSFEEGLIKHVHGKIPNKNKNIYLVKKLQNTTIDDEGNAIPAYINFAFEFDDVNKFDTFLNNLKSNYSDNEQSEHDLINVIIPDRSNKDFALKINASILNNFIEKLLQKNTEISSSTTDIDKYKLTIELRSTTDYSDKIAQLFNLNKNLLKKENTIYIYPIKKNNLRKLILLISVVLVIIPVIIVILLKIF
ncbi:hypothetical protein [Megamonas hypermegale]|uniref:hypothetical protein n=1 Tax=Megamonas hypermegale TaxID=158847 RepID=UPI00255C53F3|nr:hypothetical protein [Megamonas hypermegale]